MIKIKNCYLCGNSKFDQKEGVVRDVPELEIYQCKICGLVFLSSFDHIKDSFYKESGMHEGSLNVKAWLSNTAKDDQRRFEYLKELLPNRSLMDFGCGAGGFLLRAKEAAASVCGIELDRRLSKHFIENNLAVDRELSDQVNKANHYDIITMFHVMEHLPDPKKILLKLADLLTNRGEIIIEVPSAEDALLTLYNSKAFSEFTYWSCHLYLFTEKTLEMLFSQIGLKVN